MPVVRSDNQRYWSFLSMGNKNYPHYHIWVTWKKNSEAVETVLKVIVFTISWREEASFYFSFSFRFSLQEKKFVDWFALRNDQVLLSVLFSLLHSLIRIDKTKFISWTFIMKMVHPTNTVNKLLRALQFRKHLKGNYHHSIFNGKCTISIDRESVICKVLIESPEDNLIEKNSSICRRTMAFLEHCSFVFTFTYS